MARRKEDTLVAIIALLGRFGSDSYGRVYLILSYLVRVTSIYPIRFQLVGRTSS